MTSRYAHQIIAAALVLALMLCGLCACDKNNNVDPGDKDTVIEVAVPDDGDSAMTAIPRATEAATPAPSQAGATPTPEAGSTEEATEVPGSDEPAATDTPEPSPSGIATAQPTPYTGPETPAPTATPVPDNSFALTWLDDSAPVYCDMDFDGRNEKVEISLVPQGAYNYNCIVKITVGATGRELTDSFSVEYFTKALVNNFNTGDHRAELLVCCGSGNRGQVTRAYRLNSASNGLLSFGTNGWVETVSGNTIELGRYIDVLGTWACTCSFGFSTSDFSLVQKNSEWTVHRDSDRWCTVSQALLVQIYIPNSSEDTASFLYYGDRLYPTATDLSTYIKFTSDLDENGSITITTGTNGALLINSTSPDNWFTDLEYIH